MSHWLLEYHPRFEHTFEEWLYAYDHLHANVYPHDNTGQGDLAVVESLLPQGVSTAALHSTSPLRRIKREYLIQKAQGEVPLAYKERAKLTSYTPYYPYAVTALVGMFFDAQDDLRPVWQPEDAEEGFGDPDDAESIAYRLENDWDGAGTQFKTTLWGVAADLIALKEVWPTVEGVRRNDAGEKIGEAAVKTRLPIEVENWIEDGDSRLTEVKVRTKADTRTTIKEPEKGDAEAIKWLYYNRDGWERYILERSDSGLAAQRDAQDQFELYATTERRQRILPIYRVELPIRGNPGFDAARAANEIFNMESGLGFQLWYSCYAHHFANMINEAGEVMEAFHDYKKGFANGHTVHAGNGEFRAPPSDNADVKMAWIEQLVDRFFRTFYQQFGDAARERTATEIRQEARSGVQAFLTLLAHTLERYVNEALWRLEQMYFPDRPDLWGQARWTADKNFDPVDQGAFATQMKEIFFGKEATVPIGAAGKAEAAKRIAKAFELSVEERDVSEEIDGVQQAEALRTRRQQLAAQADERALAAEEQINGEASE